MKNLLWMLLGAVIGLMATYKYLEGYASAAFLKKTIANYENGLTNKEGTFKNASDKTGPIDVVDAKKIIENYRFTTPYALNLIKEENGRSVESWVIDLNEVRKLYPIESLSGFRVYLAQHREPNKPSWNSLVVAGVKQENGQGPYTNVFASGNRVLQYVLPCPDNCDSSVNGLGLEK